MSIAVICSKCKKQHNAPESLAGRVCRCSCGNIVQVPTVAAAPTGMESLFDELSAADMDRIKNVPKPAAEPPSHRPLMSTAVITRARSKISIPRISAIWPAILSLIWAIVILSAGWSELQKIKAEKKIASPPPGAKSRAQLAGERDGRNLIYGMAAIWGVWYAVRLAARG